MMERLCYDPAVIMLLMLLVLLCGYAQCQLNNSDSLSIKSVVCNGSECQQKPATGPYNINNAAPPGFDDKTYGRTNHSQHRPFNHDGQYWFIPPFLIGASTVIIVYIVIAVVHMNQGGN